MLGKKWNRNEVKKAREKMNHENLAKENASEYINVQRTFCSRMMITLNRTERSTKYWIRYQRIFQRLN